VRLGGCAVRSSNKDASVRGGGVADWTAAAIASHSPDTTLISGVRRWRGVTTQFDELIG